MSKQKSLADRLADLTSAAPSEAFNPDEPDFDDGTGAGLSRYDDDDEEAYDTNDTSGKGPSAGLRVAADMEMIGQEYHGKRVSRKKLEASSGAFGDTRDPEAFEGGGSDGSSDDDEDDEGGDDDDDGGGGGGGIGRGGSGGKAASSSSMATSLNLDDVSSSEDDDDGDDDDEEGEEAGHDGRGGGGGEDGTAGRRGGKHKVARPREEEEEVGGGGSSAKRQRQANVFAGVKGGDVDATVEEQIMQLNRQDEKARRSGRGVAGEAEMKRAKEALRQREWWDSMLEIRILLQRVVNASNKLPGPNELPLYLEGDASLTALAKEGADSAQGLANQLSAIRRAHMGCWGINNNNTVDGGGDDATASIMVPDDDGHGDDDDDDDEGGGDEATAARDHEKCMAWWSSVTGRWHERTQLVDPSLQKKFKVVNQGPWAQVTASLADRERTNRRAFMAESETEEFLGRRLAKIRKSSNEGGGHGDAAAQANAAAAGEGEGEGKGVETRRRRRRRRWRRRCLGARGGRRRWNPSISRLSTTATFTSTCSRSLWIRAAEAVTVTPRLAGCQCGENRARRRWTGGRRRGGRSSTSRTPRCRTSCFRRSTGRRRWNPPSSSPPCLAALGAFASAHPRTLAGALGVIFTR